MIEEKIKTILEDLLSHLSPGASIVFENGERGLFCKIDSKGTDLIGQDGETLRAITYLVRKIIEKDSEQGDASSLFIDVNGFLERRMNSLKEVALILGKRAEDFKRDVEMEPMSSFERFIIHSVFEKHPSLKTESRGFGRGRHVVIRYAPESHQEPAY